MGIDILFDKNVKTERFSDESGTDIEDYEEYLSSVPCSIQPVDDSYTERGEGQFSKNFQMFCGVCDILDGDRIVDGDKKYKVIGLQVLSFQGYSHMEILITENA